MTLLTSLRGRFLLATMLWVTLGIGAIWYSSVSVFSQHVELQYHDELEVHVLELGGLTVLDAQGRPQLARPLSDPRYAVPMSGFYWQVTRPGYGSIHSPSMTRGELDFRIASAPTIQHQLANGPTGQTIVYGFVREVGNGPPIHFVIATDKRHLDRILGTFTRELTVWLTMLALALVICGLAIVTLGFRPFGRLSASIERLREGSSPNIEGQFPDELQPLVSDLNAYIARNTEIVARGRVQAGALAHSLRTPLAIITDEAEQMQEGPRPFAATTLLQQSERMQRQIDYHLARVRSGGTRLGVAARISLREALSPLLDAMRRCYPAKCFTAEIPEDFTVAMDVDDLSEILENLLDNAGKWSRSEVNVMAFHDRIIVCDDGPGIAADRIDLVFEIGEAAQDARGGSGLGLAISRSLMRDYGGDIVLITKQEGRFWVQIVLAP